MAGKKRKVKNPLPAGESQGKKKLPTYKRLENLNIISELYCKGYPQHQIAAHMGLSQQTIWKSIKFLRQKWIAECSNRIEEYRYEQLVKIDNLEREYWFAWRRSLGQDNDIGNGKRKKTKKLLDDKRAQMKLNALKKAKTLRAFQGNPAFLAGIERCMNMRCRMLGLDAPAKQDITYTGDSMVVCMNNVDPDGL